MKIAIHDSKKEHFFSERWIEYCKKNNIPFKIVNAYDNDIVKQVSDCDAFMWHHSNYDYRDALFAKQLIYSIQKKGLKVFPDFNTTWHFDDKVGQKYLLEAIGAPLVPSYVFYTREEANKWIENTDFPKVWKLRGGSGSSNVQLVKNKQNAKKLIRKAFRRGFSQFDRINHLKFRYKNFKSGKENFLAVLKGFVRLFIGNEYSNNYTKEKGYVYFQEFIPNNKFDTRIVVVAGRAAAERRMVRENDFRASGSGDYNYEGIDLKAVKIAFDVSKRLNLQSVAFDFVYDGNNQPLIVEMSYGFGVEGISNVPGYWDSSLQWHEGKFNPQEWMMEEVVKTRIEDRLDES
ncbi:MULTISPECIES: ATP-grasp domain-containing protein [unclassified Proteiniphilum]|uniref:ATP-grasp domain-containing protein n=1 Tax=Proteiniphilum sp. UBA5310 TaxID=1947275 RepID=UPI00257C9418|nr:MULTISPECIES: hypothetical protein [unclassified Proteiniphilum]